VRFEQPLWGLLVFIVLAASWIDLKGIFRASVSLTYPNASQLQKLTPRLDQTLIKWLPDFLKILILFLIIFALARPQKVSRDISGSAEGIDIILAIDTSTSMLALDFEPKNRMQAAKKAAEEFIRNRISDRIGLLVFGGVPLLSCPLTLDYLALTEFLSTISAGMTYSQGTAIGDGIASAVNHIKDSPGKSKLIILLTDGRSNTGIIDPITAAKTAKAFGIKIYTIGTGKRGDAYIERYDPLFGRHLVRIPDSLDEDTLLKVAAETNGKYFRATDSKELAKIYSEINKLEKTKIERPETITYTDLYYLFLIPGAILLSLELFLSKTLLLKFP